MSHYICFAGIPGVDLYGSPVVNGVPPYSQMHPMQRHHQSASQQQQSMLMQGHPHAAAAAAAAAMMMAHGGSLPGQSAHGVQLDGRAHVQDIHAA